MNREAYKVTSIRGSKTGVGIEPRSWLEDAHFEVDFYPTKKGNRNLAKFICEKMNRAFRTGRRVESDAK
jgi:hypothetical protein